MGPGTKAGPGRPTVREAEQRRSGESELQQTDFQLIGQ